VNIVYNELEHLGTEQKNQLTNNIDLASSLEIVSIMNSEDQKCALAVNLIKDKIADAIDLIYLHFTLGGRLIYVGAGTSGRLGVLDASECPPTFGTDPKMVQGVIAGGYGALVKAVEGSEDDEKQAVLDLELLDLNATDVVCGIMASGRTPYVISALKWAREKKMATLLIACNSEKNIPYKADINMCVYAGPEVIMGSTRLKSGTMQKMILNMLTTGSMIRLGKVYGNVMVDLQMNSLKLVERAKKILIDICKIEYSEAEHLLNKSGASVKVALVMKLKKCEKAEANLLLNKHNGQISDLLKEIK
jgi:N-acetylmuramic acid 6-phosphate etherase